MIEGLPRIINAYGTNTRLSGRPLAPEVVAAMAEAARITVEMPAIQAWASRAITAATGAEAGIVTSGASAALLLGAAACMARLDPGAMNRLPDTTGLPDEFIIVRSQRNMYDRALRAAGGRLIEVGIPDRVSGPGVRDADPWEIAEAITPRTRCQRPNERADRRPLMTIIGMRRFEQEIMRLGHRSDSTNSARPGCQCARKRSTKRGASSGMN